MWLALKRNSLLIDLLKSLVVIVSVSSLASIGFAKAITVKSQPTELNGEALFLLPLNSQIAFNWVYTPIDLKNSNLKVSNPRFFLDDLNHPWICCNDANLVSLMDGYQLHLSSPYHDIAFLENGIPILTDGDYLGTVEVPDGFIVSNDGTVNVSFMPKQQSPLPVANVFTGSEGALYIVGNDKLKNYNVVYLLKPEKDGDVEQASVEQGKILFAISDPINALTGNGDATYFSQGKKVFKFTAWNNKITTIFEHPTDEIIQLVYNKQDGLFYTTAANVGYIGTTTAYDFLMLPNPQIALSDGILYVFNPMNFGIFCLDNIKNLGESTNK